MKRVIRLGDPTSHGGRVLSASGTTVIFGKPVARVGDTAYCPIKGHGTITLIEGDRSWHEDGKPVVLEGHRGSCGCVLISTLPNVLRSYEGAGQNETAASSKAVARLSRVVTEEDDELEYYFVAKRDDGSAIDLAYRIESGARRLGEGVLSSDGRTAALPMSDVGNAIFWIRQL